VPTYYTQFIHLLYNLYAIPIILYTGIVLIRYELFLSSIVNNSNNNNNNDNVDV